jgi:hypothetical protein
MSAPRRAVRFSRGGLPDNPIRSDRSAHLSPYGTGYTSKQGERLRQIHSRLVEARRELDALIGDAYLRPRASIVPVHFLDLAAAVEKLRWAEKEWRELDQELGRAEAAESEDESEAETEAASAR